MPIEAKLAGSRVLVEIERRRPPRAYAHSQYVNFKVTTKRASHWKIPSRRAVAGVTWVGEVPHRLVLVTLCAFRNRARKLIGSSPQVRQRAVPGGQQTSIFQRTPALRNRWYGCSSPRRKLKRSQLRPYPCGVWDHGLWRTRSALSFAMRSTATFCIFAAC
jgi:hypothetical protein